MHFSVPVILQRKVQLKKKRKGISLVVQWLRFHASSAMYALTDLNKHEVGEDVLRFYGIDFYLGDRVRQFDVDKPKNGVVVVPASKKQLLDAPFCNAYTFKELMRTQHRVSCFKDTVYVYRFTQVSSGPRPQ